MKQFLFVLLLGGLTSSGLMAQGQSLQVQNDLGRYGDAGRALSPAEVSALTEKIEEKVNLLTNYLAAIADKRQDPELRNQAVSQAVGLFLDESQVVEVSSLNRESIERFPVRIYFRRLYALPYRDVSLTFYNVSTLSALEKRPDGRWSATATIFQRFEGTTEEGLKYIDRTVKVIEILVEREKVRIGNVTTYLPAVRLGNIRVKETKL